MDTKELEELSRRAAGCLPKGFVLDDGGLKVVDGYVWDVDGEYSEPGNFWLYQHTLACTDILVNILADHHVKVSIGGGIWIDDRHGDKLAEVRWDVADGGCQALNVAILTALIALKDPT